MSAPGCALSLRSAWLLARACWRLHADRLGNHLEDVAWCGKRWLQRGGRYVA